VLAAIAVSEVTAAIGGVTEVTAVTEADVRETTVAEDAVVVKPTGSFPVLEFELNVARRNLTSAGQFPC
jgi:hypothetical protein